MFTFNDCAAVLQDTPEFNEIVGMINPTLDQTSQKEAIPKMRRALQDILHDTKRVFLHDKAHQALIILANIQPLNTEDPITYDEIEPHNSIVISTGHQFDINVLIEDHRKRPSKTKNDEDDKHIRNCFTGLNMDERDEAYVRQEALKRGLSLERQRSKTPTELWLERSSQMESILSNLYFYDPYELRMISPSIYAEDTYLQDIQVWAEQNTNEMLEPLVERGYLHEEETSTLSHEMKSILVHARSAVLAGIMSIDEAKTLSWQDSCEFYYSRGMDHEETMLGYHDFIIKLMADGAMTWQQYLDIVHKNIHILFYLRENILDKSISIDKLMFFMRDPNLCMDPKAADKIRTFVLGGVDTLVDADTLSIKEASRLYDQRATDNPDVYPFRSISVWQLITNQIMSVEDATLLTQEDLRLLEKPGVNIFDVMYELSIMERRGPAGP